ncbi:hypothetical protein FF38_12197 [Lucilia cuprina]|uniref:Uncharacterized protein n=1 Tax=Lucilia cuprina TaxID=7375 RepID=A0A0L0BR47_LUCCU|nr:hypothetical protein FF38_12197 [Lucilia cuprina]
MQRPKIFFLETAESRLFSLSVLGLVDVFKENGLRQTIIDFKADFGSIVVFYQQICVLYQVQGPTILMSLLKMIMSLDAKVYKSANDFYVITSLYNTEKQTSFKNNKPETQVEVLVAMSYSTFVGTNKVPFIKSENLVLQNFVTTDFYNDHQPHKNSPSENDLKVKINF